MEITIQDYAGTFGTNKVILNANGSEKIQGSALEGKITTNNATAVLIYQDATKGWTSQDVKLNATEISWATPTGQSLTYSTPSPQSSEGAAAATFPTTTFTATKAGEIISGTATIAGLPSGITAAQTITGSGVGNTLTVTLTGTFPAADYINTNLTLSGLTVAAPVLTTYLVVAGGGGGHGSYQSPGGGGGGAGGYLTNYSGTAITLSSATNYTVTVGAGGVRGIGDGSSITALPTNGSNSIFSTITSIGGGYGGGYSNFQSNSGGSSGGEAYGGGLGSPTGGQGYSGGSASSTTSSQNAGGGGGAGGGGSSANSANNTPGGDGGFGLSNAITGSNVFYAGGGGGGAGYQQNAGGQNGGTGGSSVGGNGGASSSVVSTATGQPGVTNTGSGGGGAGGPVGAINLTEIPGGAGGSGIVILRYPNSFTISGLSGTTTTVGTDKVTTFTTAGTGNIQFN